MDNFLSALSLARKAGKLAAGFDAAVDAVRQGRAKAVFLTKDCSPKTEKEVAFFCGRAGVAVHRTPFLMGDLTKIFSKPYGVLAVTDGQLARLAESKLDAGSAKTENPKDAGRLPYDD